MSIFTSISSCSSGKGDESKKEYTDEDLNSYISKLYIGWTILSNLKKLHLNTNNYKSTDLKVFK